MCIRDRPGAVDPGIAVVQGGVGLRQRPDFLQIGLFALLQQLGVILIQGEGLGVFGMGVQIKPQFMDDETQGLELTAGAAGHLAAVFHQMEGEVQPLSLIHIY